MQQDKYSIIIPSNNFPLAQQAKNSLQGIECEIFNGKNYPSFAKLINDCILSAKEEIVIIVNHKIRANFLHIDKMKYLIAKNYALVCLQNFHLFGFKKDLIRKIGFFDERFLGGGSEDADFIRRLIEAGLAWYDEVGVPVINLKSTWNGKVGEEMLKKKWEEKNGTFKRLLPEENYDYNLGEYKGSTFLSLEHTILSKTNADYFNSIGFKFK